MSTELPCPIGLTDLVEAYKDPHDLYDAARERAGISFDSTRESWVATGYEDVRRLLADPRLSSELPRGPRPGRAGTPSSFIQAAIERQVLFSDGEDHERVQDAIVRESTRRAHSIRPQIRKIADRLLKPVEPRGRLDLVGDFAAPFAAEVISLIMGIPLDGDGQRDELRRWSDTFGAVTSGFFRVRVQEIAHLGDFFRALIRRRAAVSSDDLIQSLLRGRVFEDEDDLVINCMMIFGAGRVTSQKVVGDGIPKLLPRWASWREAFLGDPSMSRRLTEELLRAVTPTRHVARYAVDTIELPESAGERRQIRKGERVVLFLEAANQDAAVFDAPRSLQADRHPNPHLAFGFGSHRCPGAGLARVELQVALEALFETFRDLRPDPDSEPQWDPNPNLGGHRAFPCLAGP